MLARPTRKGEVIEGAEDDIRATYYILAFQREFNDGEAELRWKVIDMMVVGGELTYSSIYCHTCIECACLTCQFCLSVLSTLPPGWANHG